MSRYPDQKPNFPYPEGQIPDWAKEDYVLKQIKLSERRDRRNWLKDQELAPDEPRQLPKYETPFWKRVKPFLRPLEVTAQAFQPFIKAYSRMDRRSGRRLSKFIFFSGMFWGIGITSAFLVTGPFYYSPRIRVHTQELPRYPGDNEESMKFWEENITFREKYGDPSTRKMGENLSLRH